VPPGRAKREPRLLAPARLACWILSCGRTIAKRHEHTARPGPAKWVFPAGKLCVPRTGRGTVGIPPAALPKHGGSGRAESGLPGCGLDLMS